MNKKLHGSQLELAEGMSKDIYEVLERYNEAVSLPLVVGVLEMVKVQVLFDHSEFETDEEEDDE